MSILHSTGGLARKCQETKWWKRSIETGLPRPAASSPQTYCRSPPRATPGARKALLHGCEVPMDQGKVMLLFWLPFEGKQNGTKKRHPAVFCFFGLPCFFFRTCSAFYSKQSPYPLLRPEPALAAPATSSAAGTWGADRRLLHPQTDVVSW